MLILKPRRGSAPDGRSLAAEELLDGGAEGPSEAREDALPVPLEGEQLLLGDSQGLGEFHLGETMVFAVGGDPPAELFRECRFHWPHR